MPGRLASETVWVRGRLPGLLEGMSLPEKILVALDSQGACEAALQAALWLARRGQSRVEYIHAFPERPWIFGAAEKLAEWSQGRDAALAQLRGNLGLWASRVPASMQPIYTPDPELLAVEIGVPARVISERARTSGARLLFLGPHRHRRGVSFENTLRAVLSESRIPVWVQPQPARAVRSILAPIDFSALSRSSLAHAQSLARELGAKLTVAHVFEPPTLGATSTMPMPEPHLVVDELRKRTQAEFHAELKRQGLADEALFLEGDPAECIEEQAARFDLIVLGSHGRSALGAAFLGSVTQTLARAPATALLVVPPPIPS